ncbi:hypothetical protein LTR95_000824 [Oleoguttula sp. CCFEE 5521]
MPRTPEATPQESQRRVTRSSSSAKQKSAIITPQRPRRKTSVVSQDSDVVEIPKERFDDRPKLRRKVAQPQKAMVLRRSSIDSALKLGTHVRFLFFGPNRTPTTLHTNILPPSTVTALQELYQNGFIVLETHSVESVELYRVWLYTGRLCTRVPDEEEIEAEEVVLADREWGRLANAYTLAVELRDEKFANLIVDAMIEKVDGSDRYPTSLATDLSASLPRNDKLCNWIVDFHVWKGLGTGIRRPHADAEGPVAFLREVTRNLVAAGDAVYNPKLPEPWKVYPCQ